MILRGLVLFLLCAVPAWGRLGETEEQCVARYGPVLYRLNVTSEEMALTILSFEKNGYRFAVTMYEGGAVLIFINKVGAEQLDEEEIQTLLKTEQGTESWGPNPDVPGKVSWKRSDGTVFAEYDAKKREMLFVSTKCLKLLNSRGHEVESAAEKMKDF